MTCFPRSYYSSAHFCILQNFPRALCFCFARRPKTFYLYQVNKPPFPEEGLTFPLRGHKLSVRRLRKVFKRTMWQHLIWKCMQLLGHTQWGICPGASFRGDHGPWRDNLGFYHGLECAMTYAPGHYVVKDSYPPLVGLAEGSFLWAPLHQPWPHLRFSHLPHHTPTYLNSASFYFASSHHASPVAIQFTTFLLFAAWLPLMIISVSPKSSSHTSKSNTG